MPAPAREPAFFIIPACRRICKYELAELRFSAAVAYRPPFGSGYVHLFPHFYRFSVFPVFFKKGLAFFGRVCYIIFRREKFASEIIFIAAFLLIKQTGAGRDPPPDLLRSDFYKSQPERRNRLSDWLILPCSYFALYFPRPAPESPISVPFQMRTKFSRCLMRMASVATQRMARGIQPLRMAV